MIPPSSCMDVCRMSHDFYLPSLVSLQVDTSLETHSPLLVRVMVYLVTGFLIIQIFIHLAHNTEALQRLSQQELTSADLQEVSM